MPTRIAVGFVYRGKQNADEIDLLKSSLASLMSADVAEEMVFGLAGAGNEVLKWIMDPPAWAVFLAGAAGRELAHAAIGMASGAVIESARAVAQRMLRPAVSPIRDVLRALRNARVKGQDVGVAIEHPSLPRQANLRLGGGDDESMLLPILAFALGADAIYAAVEAELRSGRQLRLENDMSVQATVHPDGSIWMFGRCVYGCADETRGA